jgi:hypothetical protein
VVHHRNNTIFDRHLDSLFCWYNHFQTCFYLWGTPLEFVP